MLAEILEIQVLGRQGTDILYQKEKKKHHENIKAGTTEDLE